MACHCTVHLHYVCGYLRPGLRQEPPNLSMKGRVTITLQGAFFRVSRDQSPVRRPVACEAPAMWWIAETIVGWAAVGAYVAMWLGRAINNAELQEPHRFSR